MQLTKSITIIIFIDTEYKVIFAPFSLANNFSPFWINIWDFGVCPVLNLPADKGKRGENEMGANNFSYKVYKCEIYKQHQYMNNSLEKLLKTALIKNIINSNEFYKFQPLKK